MTLPEKLKMLRERRGLSQSRLGRMVGLSQQQVSNWESWSGENPLAWSIPLERAAALARAFGVPLEYLADDAADEPPVVPTSEWELKALEVVRAIGAERAWRMLIGAGAGAGAEGSPPRVVQSTVVGPGALPSPREKKGAG